LRLAPGTLALSKQQFPATLALGFPDVFENQPISMLRWIITFLVVAIIAGLFGFTGVAGAATDIARILFYIFLVLLLVAVVAGLFRGSPPAP
jgi:uncharacterized membrane protein YtjA (UPF0391 family)